MKALIALAFCSILSGQKIAFVQNRQLWVKQLPGGSARVIVSTGNPHAPSFSPDGAWIAFLDDDRLAVVASAGGEIQHPLGALLVPRFRWSPSGATLAVATEDSVYLASESTGWTPSRIFAGDPEAMVFSPDGKQIAIASLESNQDEMPLRGRIEIYPIGANAPVSTIQTASEWEQILPFAWSGDTILAWKGEISGSAESDGFEIWAYSTSGAEPRKLSGSALVSEELHALSPDGKTLALTDGEGRLAWTQKRITLVDLETGKSTPLTSTDTAALYPAWSPKGDAIAFTAGPDAGDTWGGDEAKAALNQRHLWIMNPDGSSKRQLTSDPAFRDEQPVWLNDGKSLFFIRLDHDDHAAVWSIDRSGGEPRQLAGPVDLDEEEGWFGFYGHIDWTDRIAIKLK